MEDTLIDENGSTVGENATGTKGLMFTVCAHVFHNACLDKLRDAGRDAGQFELNCPNCRSPISAPISPAAMMSHATSTSGPRMSGSRVNP